MRATRPPAVTRPGAWFVDFAAEPAGVFAAGHEMDQGQELALHLIKNVCECD